MNGIRNNIGGRARNRHTWVAGHSPSPGHRARKTQRLAIALCSLEDWRDARRAEEAFSKRGEGKSKKRGRKIKGKGSKIQNSCFRQSRLFNGLGQVIKESDNLLALARPLNNKSALRKHCAPTPRCPPGSQPGSPTASTLALTSDFRKQLSKFLILHRPTPFRPSPLPALAGCCQGALQIGGGSGGGAGCASRHRAMIGSSVSLRQNLGAPMSLRHAAFQ